MSLSIATLTIFKVIKAIKKVDYGKAFLPFINLLIIFICEILISYFDNYKKYLLYFILLNGLYFGITISKLILGTMSHKKLEIPTVEGTFYIFTIILGLIFPNYEIIICIIQGLFIILYYISFYGKLIKQLMKELKIDIF